MRSHDRIPNLWLPEAVLGFPDSGRSARALAGAMGAAYADIAIHAFPDGESRVTIADIDALRGKRVAFFRALNHANAQIVELILAASILGSEADITLVAPYLPYMRQDKAFATGEAVSQQAIGKLLAGYFSRIVTFDPHLHRTSSLAAVFPGRPGRALSAADAMAAFIRAEGPRGVLLLGPDEESLPLVGRVAVRASCEWSVARKQRQGDRQVAIALPETVSFAGRQVVIVDDVISSGHTIAAVTAAVLAAGAARVTACVTHALYGAEAAAVMGAAGLAQVASSDSVPHASNRFSIIDTLARSLKDGHDD